MLLVNCKENLIFSTTKNKSLHTHRHKTHSLNDCHNIEIWWCFRAFFLLIEIFISWNGSVEKLRTWMIEMNIPICSHTEVYASLDTFNFPPISSLSFWVGLKRKCSCIFKASWHRICARDHFSLVSTRSHSIFSQLIFLAPFAILDYKEPAHKCLTDKIS